MKKVTEFLIEQIMRLSALTSSLVIVLIVVFLFREGWSLFSTSSVEQGYVIALNRTNPIKNLSSNDIRRIFDQEITTWNAFGGQTQEIMLFRTEDIYNYYSEEEVGFDMEHLAQKIDEIVAKNPNIIAFFPKEYLAKKFSGKVLPIKEVSAKDFFIGRTWLPTAQPAAQVGALSLIFGTTLVSIIAILIALPLGLATAIYMAEIATPKIRNLLKPIIELLAGIPSVVYGFFGLMVIVPLLKDTFGLDSGQSGLAGGILLAIMALPTIITISEDALRNTPQAMKESSLALGATQWQTIYKIVIPYSSSGITAAAILGIGRAMGETMAVLMVTGNAAVIPHSILEPLRTIPATIASELGEAPQGGLHYQALFGLGCILFLITFATNLIAGYVTKKHKH